MRLIAGLFQPLRPGRVFVKCITPLVDNGIPDTAPDTLEGVEPIVVYPDIRRGESRSAGIIRLEESEIDAKI